MGDKIDFFAPPTEEERASVDFFAPPSQRDVERFQSKERVINDAILNYNEASGNPTKAEAYSELYFNPLDQNGSVYLGSEQDPTARIKSLQKIINPSDADTEVSKKMLPGSVFDMEVPMKVPEKEKEGKSSLASLTDEEIIAKGGSVMRQGTPGISESVRTAWEAITDWVRTGETDTKSVQFKDTMQAHFQPNIGKAVKEGMERDELSRREFIMKDQGMVSRAMMRNFQNVKKIPIALMNMLEEVPLPSATPGDNQKTIDLMPDAIRKPLEKDVEMWMKAAEVPQYLQEDWAANKGSLWKRPDFWTNFLIESSATMGLALATGGQSQVAIGSKLWSVMAYAGGSAAVEAASNAGDAVIRAEEMGATTEQKSKIAAQVFREDFITSSTLNAIGFGAGSGTFTKMLKNPMVKAAVWIVALGGEGEQELRQDEIVEKAIADHVSKHVLDQDPWYQVRYMKGLMNPETRDITIMSTVMGLADPAMGYLSELKNKVKKTGEGKGALDQAVNYTKKKMEKDLALYDKKKDLDEYSMERHEILKKHRDNVEVAATELKALDARNMKEAYDRTTVQGIIEDSSLGEDVKAQVESLPPSERATPEIINKVADQLDSLGLTKEEATQIRETYNLDEMTQAEAVAWESAVTNAKAQGMEARALEVAGNVLASPADNLVTMTQHAAFVLKEIQLQKDYDAKLKEAREASNAGNNALAKEKQASANQILKNIDLITEASVRGGTALARAFNFRKIRLNRETNSLAHMTRQAENLKGEKLSPKQIETLQTLETTIKEKSERIKELEQLLEEQQNNEDGEGFISETVAKIKKQKGTRSKQAIQERIEAAKQRIRDRGHRVSMGVDPETAIDIAIVAEGYVEQGIKKLPDLMKQLTSDFVDISERDIYNSFAGRRPSTIKKTLSDVQMLVKELKKQSKKKAQILDAYDKIFDPQRTKAPTSQELISLFNELQELKQQYAMTELNQLKLDEVSGRLAEVQEFLEQGTRPEKMKQLTYDKAVQKATQQLNEALALMKTKDKLAELYTASETYKTTDPEVVAGTKKKGDLKNEAELMKLVEPKERKSILSRELEKAKLELFTARRHAKVKISSMAKWNAGKVVEVLGGSMMAATLSMDLGAFLRQGKITSTSHFPTAMAELGKALQMQGYGVLYQKEAMQAIFDKFMKEMYDNPNYSTWKKHKLALTDPIEGLSHREEGFTSANIIEKIPYWGSSLIKSSENAHIMFLNGMRMALFDQFANNLPTNMGEARRTQVLDAYAQYINSATGRGTLPGGFEKSAQALTRIFLAPRWAWSNFQMAGLTPQNYKMFAKFPEMRKQMAIDYGAFFVSRAAFLAAGMVGGGEVTFDPDDPDFLKLKFGNTRIDPWGGMIQPARFMLNLAWIARQQWSEDRKKQATAQVLDKFKRYLFYKTNPLVGAGMGMITRENVLGKEESEFDRFWKAFTPIIIQTSSELVQDQGDESLIWGIPAEFFGLNVSTYESKNKRSKSAYKGL